MEIFQLLLKLSLTLLAQTDLAYDLYIHNHISISIILWSNSPYVNKTIIQPKSSYSSLTN